MAKVKIQGHASGTGILTVTAPNTSTDRTITLPDADVTLGAATPSITDGGNATAMTIDASENVGFGTASPSGKVHIKDGGYRQGIVLERAGSTSDRGFIYIGDGTNSTTADEVYLDGNNTAFHFRTGGSGTTAALDITSDGRGLSQFTAAFWARVNMEGTFSIIGSHNVSSVTDRGVGKGTLTFANNLGNANYCVTGSAFSGGGENDQREFQHSNERTWSTSAWDWCTMDELEANNDITSANMIGFGG